MKFLVAQYVYLLCCSTLALGVVVDPGATIVGPGEPGTLVKGPSSKATVKGPSGPLIVTSGDTGAVTSAGKAGGVVSASPQVGGNVAPDASLRQAAPAVPLAPSRLPKYIPVPYEDDVFLGDHDYFLGGSIAPVLSQAPLVAPAAIPAAIEVPITAEVVPVAAYANSKYTAVPYEQYVPSGVQPIPADHIY